jgi:peptide-methionine (S)-S-oxide reductase
MTSRILSTSITLTLAVVLGMATSATAQNTTTTEPAGTQPKAESTEPVKQPEAAKPGATKPKETTKSKGTTKPKYERATFGAGCFWHVEAVFERLPGVQSAVSGYSGGDPRFRSYDMVHEGWTGHAEVVQVVYDPEAITYDDLLKVFWSNHDPTTLNRQGEDEGTQYRSVIFYHNKEQREAALKSYQNLTKAGVFRDPIVTQLMPMKKFLVAEPEHQDYYGGKPRATARRSKTALKKATKTQTKANSSSSTADSAQPEPASPTAKTSD